MNKLTITLIVVMELIVLILNLGFNIEVYTSIAIAYLFILTAYLILAKTKWQYIIAILALQGAVALALYPFGLAQFGWLLILAVCSALILFEKSQHRSSKFRFN